MNVSNTLSTPVKTMSAGITFLLASACGLIVANLYYAQPLIGLISIDLGLPSAAAGLIVTITRVCYVLGILLIVPLGDLFENRRLVLISIGLAAFALLGAALSQNAWMFLTSSLLIGICSVAVHVLLPCAAHLSPEATRG
jgi:MFS family permease